MHLVAVQSVPMSWYLQAYNYIVSHLYGSKIWNPNKLFWEEQLSNGQNQFVQPVDSIIQMTLKEGENIESYAPYVLQRDNTPSCLLPTLYFQPFIKNTHM